jgi:hypothetical protein
MIKCDNSQVNIKASGKRRQIHKTATISASGVVAGNVATLRFFKKFAENARTHQVDLRSVEEELSHRVLCHPPVLEDTILRSIQPAKGKPALRDELPDGVPIRVSHNYTFSSILMGAQVFPIPSCPLRPNIAKKTFSGIYFRYMSTSIFCQNSIFCIIFEEKVDLFKKYISSSDICFKF